MKTQLGFCFGLICLVLARPVFAVDGKPSKESVKERMKQFDTDGDGKLSADEKAAAKQLLGERKSGKPGDASTGKRTMQQMILEKFDANGNGKLDPEEQTAARKAAIEMKKNKGKRGQNQGQPNGENAFNPGNGLNGLNGQPLGGNGGGARGNGSGRAKLLERFDMNRDGRLSEEEMARAKQMMGGGGNLPPGFSQPGVQPNPKLQGKFRQ